ncbi:MAG TPA: leucine-rich repeat domain-containing protein, partial [Micromonospora sp.]|nr:leucine-rich repeat domain-containing protein [Micromonospora sp.]
MTINEHIAEFAGLPVHSFDLSADRPADPATVAWRLSADYDTKPEEFADLVEAFLDQVDPAAIRALIIGQWGEAY